MAYVEMPLIDPSTVCLIALNSPYLNRASEYCCSIEEVAREYVQEIRKRQPHGPYVLGGWSAGGYYSYEVACELIRQGERVRKLILLDSPCRPDFEELPMEVVQYLSEKNLMGNWDRSGRPTNVPSWVIEHFRSTLRAVREYIPVPMDASNAPEEVYIIWSREGVMPTNQLQQTGLDLRVRVARFLLEGKPDLASAYGWDRLFPGAHISISSISGNHFTLINKPNVSARSFRKLFKTHLLTFSI
jgi:thioesterase domain-containing protein